MPGLRRIGLQRYPGLIVTPRRFVFHVAPPSAAPSPHGPKSSVRTCRRTQSMVQSLLPLIALTTDGNKGTSREPTIASANTRRSAHAGAMVRVTCCRPTSMTFRSPRHRRTAAALTPSSATTASRTSPTNARRCKHSAPSSRRADTCSSSTTPAATRSTRSTATPLRRSATTCCREAPTRAGCCSRPPAPACGSRIPLSATSPPPTGRESELVRPARRVRNGRAPVTHHARTGGSTTARLPRGTVSKWSGAHATAGFRNVVSLYSMNAQERMKP